MAGFEGIRWASTQLRYDLTTEEVAVEGVDAKVFAVSRSIHYGLFLAFEGIRFRCRTDERGRLRFTFLNLDVNVDRFRRGMQFLLADDAAGLVPEADQIKHLFLHYLSLPENRELFLEMARTGRQGYLRPFTVDEEQSIGVTFPQRPCMRMVAAAYDRYLGEPFSGVVVPRLVRAVGVNGTGCLKLGVNYLISIKAVARARKVHASASSALFLDDRPDLPIGERKITEWDSSCALVALRDGTFIKIPESPLILPSVTIRGIADILSMKGHPVVERDITYGELLERTRAGEVVTVCSIGTAGILNRCSQLHLFNGEEVEAVLRADNTHPSFGALAAARKHYWDIYALRAEPPAGHVVEEFEALDAQLSGAGRRRPADPLHPEEWSCL
jgi:branched-subunit amino acid aminotransferase/4-amino-4-deoxychorismate lyase